MPVKDVVGHFVSVRDVGGALCASEGCWGHFVPVMDVGGHFVPVRVV